MGEKWNEWGRKKTANNFICSDWAREEKMGNTERFLSVWFSPTSIANTRHGFFSFCLRISPRLWGAIKSNVGHTQQKETRVTLFVFRDNKGNWFKICLREGVVQELFQAFFFFFSLVFQGTRVSRQKSLHLLSCEEENAVIGAKINWVTPLLSNVTLCLRGPSSACPVKASLRKFVQGLKSNITCCKWCCWSEKECFFLPSF